MFKSQLNTATLIFILFFQTHVQQLSLQLCCSIIQIVHQSTSVVQFSQDLKPTYSHCTMTKNVHRIMCSTLVQDLFLLKREMNAPLYCIQYL